MNIIGNHNHKCETKSNNIFDWNIIIGKENSIMFTPEDEDA